MNLAKNGLEEALDEGKEHVNSYREVIDKTPPL